MAQYTNCKLIYINPDNDNKAEVTTVAKLGFPGYTGKMLLAHYTDDVKVKQLINLGDLYQIGKSSDEIKEGTYSSVEDHIHQNNHCVSVKRDIDPESNIQFTIRNVVGRKDKTIFENEIEAKRILDKEPSNYSYMFKDGKWYFRYWTTRFEEMNHLRISHDEEEDG